MENKKTCQNCKQEFTIEPDDFAFYEMMHVPAPTFCPDCRFQRRIMFRDERVLYKRTCDLCGASMVSIFSPEKPFPVYCAPCWWSDNWDDGAIFLDYNPNKNIFDQMNELQRKTPHMALINDYATLVNSDYVNHAGSCKNCYLIFNADFNENVAYSNIVVRVKDSMDCIMVGESELIYQSVDASGQRVFFCEDVEDCYDTYFSADCVGCGNCFGCYGLRNKNYHIFNQPHRKEEYVEKLKEFRLDSWKELQKVQQQAREFWLKFPHRWMHGVPQNINVSGDYIYNAKNALNCYQTRQLEDARYCQFITMKPAKDLYDLTEWGNGAERVVDSLTVGEGAYNVKYCAGAWHTGTMNVEYGMYNVWCQNTFACINLKKKEYRILNKKYAPEEYKKLREEVIKNMNEKPYVDSKGRVWKYGEFLPYDLSPFAYNETQAVQYWPLTKEQIEERGWRWREPTPGKYTITMPDDKMPDSIHDVKDSILDEILGCGKCGRAFRLINLELQLLQKWQFPIPRYCPDCRHMERMARINPPRLWDRACAKCQSPIQTSYAPDRLEIVYCETCYQQEVV